MTVSRLGFVRVLEFVLTGICIGLHFQGQTHTDFTTDFITASAFGGYFIILIGGFAGHVTGNPINKNIDIFFCLAGCAVFVAAGALNIEEDRPTWKSERDYGLAKASIAIINVDPSSIPCTAVSALFGASSAEE